LPNIFRARPYLSDSYDSYWCELAKSDPFDHPEDCLDCKPYDDYWSGFDVGFLCGSINKIVIVDIDPRNIFQFKDMDMFIRKIEHKHGPLPPTWKVSTPSGGIHLYYKYPHRFNSNKGQHIAGVDFLGDNSWAKFPPSVKSDGREYRWLIHPTLDNLAELPSWIAAIAHLKPVQPKPISRPKFIVYSNDVEKQARSILEQIDIHTVNHSLWRDIGYILCGNLKLEHVFVDWCMRDTRTEKLVRQSQLTHFRGGQANSLGALVALLRNNSISIKGF
jgi:hypothetical protein